jgi:hypothetical protein
MYEVLETDTQQERQFVPRLLGLAQHTVESTSFEGVDACG